MVEEIDSSTVIDHNPMFSVSILVRNWLWFHEAFRKKFGLFKIEYAFDEIWCWISILSLISHLILVNLVVTILIQGLNDSQSLRFGHFRFLGTAFGTFPAAVLLRVSRGRMVP